MPDTVSTHSVIRAVMALSFAAVLGTAGLYFAEHPGFTLAPEEEHNHSESARTEEKTSKSTIEEHISALMQQLQQDPGNASIILSIAEHFLDAGKPEQAEKFAQRALDIQPENPDALYIRGLSRHTLGKNNAAAEDLEASLAKREDPSIRYSLGVLYAYFIKDAAKARTEFSKALTLPGLPPDLEEMVRTELTKLQELSSPANR